MSDILEIEQRIIGDLIGTDKRSALIEKLSFYTRFENQKRYSNFLKIVFVLLERAKNEYELVSNILLKSIFIETNKLEQKEDFSRSETFVDEVKKGTVKPFVGLSTFIRRLIAADIDKEPLSGGRLVRDLISRDTLIDCNIHLLKTHIHDFGTTGKENLDNALMLLYNCIYNIEGEERLTRLDNRATELVLPKLKANLDDYLKAFIRPKYVTNSRLFPEYNLYVPEPFYEQIFGSIDKFKELLEEYLQTHSNSTLAKDIQSFIIKLEENRANGSGSVNLETLELSCTDHLFIRPEIKEKIKDSLPPSSL